MVPLLMFGRWGTPIPHRSPLTIVLGAPLGLPRHDDPPPELVQKHLDAYIAAMEGIFERHKAAAGFKDWRLRIL
jgi:hypothetical protein